MNIQKRLKKQWYGANRKRRKKQRDAVKAVAARLLDTKERGAMFREDGLNVPILWDWDTTTHYKGIQR